MKTRGTGHGSSEDRVRAFVDRALQSEGPVPWGFWLRAAAEVITAEPTGRQEALYHSAARRTATTVRVDPRERQAAIRHLAAQVLPVA